MICFDTETVKEQTPDSEVHRLRLWAAQLDVRRAKRQVEVGTTSSWGRSIAGLAAQLDVWCAGRAATWVYAHNLSFDLAVTRLPVAMQAVGWEVTDHAVGTDTPWLRMRRGQSIITFADSWGWLRAPLEAIGADVGVAKPPLPDWDESEDAWRRRCEGDVAILAAAMLQLMGWWDSAHLGCWSLTGSASGFNAMRHMLGERSILICHGTGQAEADRAAVYGGRRDAFRHGPQDSGPYVLLDFRRAYTVACRDLPLPVRRRGDFAGLEVDSQLIDSKRWGIIAQVEVETDTPRWPVRIGGRVAYPVGRFVTTLASPEIAEARRLGCLRSIGPGYLHQLGTPLQPWATWCLQLQDETDPSVPRVALRALKHWGRAVPGKFGAHGFDKADAGPAQHGGWWYEACWNHGRAAPGHLVEVGARQSEITQTAVSDNAYPAVLAFIESYVRVALTRAIEAIGRDHVICCDTDGLIVADSCAWREAIAAADLAPFTLRAKGTYPSVTVFGPQHIVAPGDRKLAGVPRSAEQLPDGRLRATLWPKLGWQMGNGAPDAYVRPVAHYRVAPSYVTGWVLEDGGVAPLEAVVCPDGGTHLMAWQDSGACSAGGVPAAAQAVGMDKITDTREQVVEGCSSHGYKSSGTDTGSIASSRTKSSKSGRRRAGRAAIRVVTWLMRGRGGANAAPLESSG